MVKRLLPTAAVLLLSIVLLGCVVWAQLGAFGIVLFESSSSAVRPVRALQALMRALNNADLFSEFNLPLRSMGVHIAWLLGVTGIGNILLRRVPLATRTGERLVFSFAAGYVFVGTILLIIGMAGFLQPAAMWSLMTILLLIGASQARLYVGTFKARKQIQGVTKPSAAGVLVWALFVFAVTAAYVYALTPPIQSDAMRYHLAAPQEFIKAGRITYLPHNAFSNFPFLPEMHFMLALGLGAPEASQLMHVTIFVFCALAIRAFCLRFVGRFSGRHNPPWMTPVLRAFPMALYLAVPASLVIAGWPFIDHAVTLFFFLSLYTAILAAQAPTATRFALCGAMMGAAAGCKYTAAAFLPIIGVCALIELGSSLRERPAKAQSRPYATYFAIMFMTMLATGGLWYVKSALYTGNPVYPLAHGIFPGGEWTDADAKLYAAKAGEKGLPKSVTNLFRAPVDATFHWSRPIQGFESHYLSGYLLFLMAAGVGGLIVSWQLGPRERSIIYAVVAAFGFYGMWFFTYQSNRLILPMLALLIPPAYATVVALARQAPGSTGVLCLALILACIHSIGWVVQWIYAQSPMSPNPLAYVAGGVSKQEFLTRSLNYHGAFEFLNDKVSKGERVLLIGEHRIYGATFDAVWSDWFDTPAVLAMIRANKVTNVDDLAVLLDSHEIRWILYNDAELAPQYELYFRPRFTNEELNLVQEFVKQSGAQRWKIPPGVTVIRL